jgi:hypothetical protein
MIIRLISSMPRDHGLRVSSRIHEVKETNSGCFIQVSSAAPKSRLHCYADIGVRRDGFIKIINKFLEAEFFLGS